MQAITTIGLDIAKSKLSQIMPGAFGPPSEVVLGVLYGEAAKAWGQWNPLIWTVISRRGCLGAGDPRQFPAIR